MELEKAIDILENVIADEVIGTYCLEIQKEVECSKNCENEDCFLQQAIDTVLKELQILKKENDTLWEENIKLKQLNIAYKLRINDFTIDIHKAHAEGYQDGFKQAKFDCEMDKLDGR